MYNIKTLIKTLLIIILFIITPVILISYFVENSSSSKTDTSINESIINYNSNNNDTAYNYSFPTERVFIIKLDDIQGYAWNDMFINMTEEILKRNLSVTLSVIPLSLQNDKKAIDFLITETSNSHVEIAMHGTTHSDNEYEHTNESETFKLATTGLNEIERVLKVRPITFIPPANKYNGSETTKALSKLGFIFIGSTHDNFGFDNYMNYIGWTEAATDVNDNLTSIKQITEDCNESLDKRNVCVVTIHPQDYVDKNDILDNTKYNKFIYLLDSLKLVNATSITYKDLMKYYK